MRLEPLTFRMEMEGTRAEEHPKRFTHYHIHYLLEGELPEDKVVRAIRLSKDTYCSVYHSLNASIEVSYSINGVKGRQKYSTSPWPLGFRFEGFLIVSWRHYWMQVDQFFRFPFELVNMEVLISQIRGVMDMSVHKDITLHAQKQNEQFTEFSLLDQKREEYIQEAVELCKADMDFSTDSINQITMQINALANERFIPARKMVTTEMVRTYVGTLA